MSAIAHADAELVPMQQENLAAIHRIETDVYEYPWSEGNLRDSMAAGYECLTYRHAGTLVGYAVMMISLDEAHILNLSIARSFQRQGFGQSLLDRLCAMARARAVRRMLLEVRPSNTAARGLYARNGFTEVGIRRGYYPAREGREDAIILERRL
jgi:[ribosomal protein S18]-alanine N-acetyltransferase